MSTDKSKAQSSKPANAKTAAQPATPAPGAPVKVPPLFRKIDWLAMGITTVLLFVAYFFMLAPDQTLEDSGELATGSFYAGVPHPPGYPVWTIFTYFFANFIPYGSVAWRVGIASAVAASLSCGLLALLVSRGSSMMIEGIAGLKEIERRWEGAICVVSGFVAGCLIGFNGFMWSQAVIVEVYPFSVLSFMGVLLCLMRWIYAPEQRRYLYIAFFLFGICFTNHQTLLLAAPGIEVAILAGNSRIGRNLFAGNGIIYFFGLLFFVKGLALGPTFNGSPSMFTLFNVIGLGSLYVFLWYYLKAKLSTRLLLVGGHFLINIIVYMVWSKSNGSAHPTMSTDEYAQWLIFINPILVLLIYLFCLITGSAEAAVPFNWAILRREWGPPWIGLFCWIAGAAFYLYMPITSATNPPMNWGYPRTWEGFIHAISRGQYGSTNPVNVFDDPFRFLSQILLVLEGVVEEFSWLYLLIALVPFLFFLKMQKRERAWVIGITAIYISLAGLLMMMLNSTPDRQSQDLNKVFFAASHILIAMGVGYGLTLVAACMATHYATFRKTSILGSLAALDFAFFVLIVAAQDLLSNALDTTAIMHHGFGKALCWLVIAVCFGLSQRQRFQLERPIFLTVGIIAGVCSIGFTIATMLGNSFKLDGLLDFAHTLAISFHKDQFALPVYAAMIVLALALIFLAAVCLRRDRAPMALALAVFAAMPIYPALSHWGENEQRGHWFGFWFGHDMFTPPFTDPHTGKLSYDPKLREEAMKGPNGDLVYPEMARNTVLFGGTDPGRFCPTYMIFCESFVPPRCKPMDPNYDRRDVYIITQNALADGTYLDYIRAQYFRSSQNALGLDTPFFRDAIKNTLGAVLGQDNPLVRGLGSVAYTLFDKPIAKFGAHIEAERRAEGVYPHNEIYTPTPEDSQRCFQDYMEDAQRRMQIGQLRPGEDVHVENGRVQVSGQVAVMMINGLLCKVIFDHNPTNEFYVEESFPLEWMYPYETPFGIIMKINRHPLPSLPEVVFKRDHEFWSNYSERLIGNWITYDTTVQEIANFAEKVYVRNDFSGFKGDRKFARDDDAQKAFSKLRSSIAGMYAYRLSPQCPPEYRPKNAVEQQELVREADFAFKQSFAFCPYSPEAVFRYVNLLLSLNRLDDAMIVAKTCQKLDPYNDQISSLIKQLDDFKKQSPHQVEAQGQLQQMEQEAAANPTNIRNLLTLGSYYLQMQQTNEAIALFDKALASPNVEFNDVAILAQFYAQIFDFPKLETALEKLVALAPDRPEARYDLAALKAILGKTNESLENLKIALDMSAKRLQHDPKAPDLESIVRSDHRFDGIRSSPEFQKLVPPK